MGKTGRVLFKHMTTPNTNDNVDKLTRKDQATIFRLRIEHIPLNIHLNRIGAIAEKACPLCNHPEETVKHHLFYCTKLKDLRERFLPSQPDKQNTLSETVSHLKTHVIFTICHFAKWPEPTSCWIAKKKIKITVF